MQGKKFVFAGKRANSALTEEIQNAEFDYFISNGLPVILPIEKLQKEGKKFINIHPSLLPELRGKDPVPGALLYQREAGLLYQLSFIAEAEVFEKAYEKNFVAEGKQNQRGDEIYYSFKQDDLKIAKMWSYQEEMEQGEIWRWKKI